jgi:hypothetical protein
MSKTLLKSFLHHFKQNKFFDFFLPIPYTWSHVTDLPTSKNKSRQNISKTLLKYFLHHKKQKKNFRFFSPHTLYIESCNGFADLENQKSSKHVQIPFKIIFRA